MLAEATIRINRATTAGGIFETLPTLR